MQHSDNQTSKNIENPIHILDIFYILLKEKLTVAFITISISIMAVIYSLSLPNIYKSTAVLVPVNSSSNISGALQGYSGIASLVGVNLPSEGGDNNSVQAIEKLGSLSFFKDHLLIDIFLPNLMAIKSWEPKTNKLIYDDSIYNKTTKTWIRDFSFPQKQVPSAQESYEVFKTHISLGEDTNTGFLSLSVKHQSPYIAEKWTNLIISNINSYYLAKDKSEAQKAIDYLKNQMSVTNISEIKQVMAELLQKEIQKLTLMEASEAYVFEYIDPPVVMEKKSEPKRSLICILGSILGFIFGALIAVFKYYRSESQST